MQGMDDILRQAQAMQTRMMELQDALAQKRVEGSSGGGMVRVVCTGKQELLSIAIEKSVIDPEEPEMLQDLVVAAVNNALKLSRELAERDLASLTGGLRFPGMP